jgi:hypothetical protein
MLSLPNELLSHTFKFNLRQSDLASLCRVHKHVYPTAREQLYRKVHLQGLIPLHLLIRSIALNPSLASLVKKLRLSHTPLNDDCPSELKGSRGLSEFTNSTGEYPVETMYTQGETQRLLEWAGHLTALPCPPFRYMETLLFQSLQKLQSLELYQDVFLAGASPDATRIVQMFPALQTFTYGNEAFTKPMHLEELLPIFFVPTMRTITLWYLHTDHLSTLDRSMLVSSYGTSSVETIRLHHVGIDTTTVVDLCKLPKHLKEFQCRDPISNGILMHPHVCVHYLDWITGHISRTLERLVIHYNHPSRELQTGSLCQYTSLRKLVIPPHIVFGTRYSPSIEMAGLLPRTLEHLSFITTSLHWSVSDYVAVLRRIIEQKAKHNPELSVVVLWVTSGAVAGMQMLQEVASKAKVRLGMANPHEPDQFQIIPLEHLTNDMDAYLYSAFRKHPRHNL